MEDEIKYKIIEEYKKGKSIYALVRKYKKTEARIRNMLTREGIKIRGHDVNKETIAKITEYKQQGLKNKDIAAMLKLTEQQVSYYIKKYLKTEQNT